MPIFIVLFQFLYGAIKSFIFNRFQLLDVSFQFLYGAIKRRKSLRIFIFPASFNSSMVRLKAKAAQKLSSELNVSIPLWCD